jgi:ABC-2 type transport system permease protein
MGLSLGQMALPFVPLAAQLLVYAALALVLSMALPSRSAAAAVAGGVMVASYLLSSLARVMDGLAPLARALPYEHYQGADAINGLAVLPLAGVLAAAVLMTALAWWRFERRDVRVVGEGEWRLRGRRGAVSRG